MRKRYTKDELNIILNWLKKYPSNYSEAFRRAAKELGRTYNSVSTSFYASKKFKKFFTENPVIGISSNSVLVEVNRKNCANIEGVSHPDDIQVPTKPLGIINHTSSKAIIRMQDASFQIGDIMIKGTNIEIIKLD